MNKNFLNKLISFGLLCSILTYSLPVFSYMNEETVYSKLDSEGNRYKTIVTTIEEDKNDTNISQEENDNELPIECKITYKLNDKEISSDEKEEKKGKVTITLEFINKNEQEVMINGNKEKVYTPFVVVSGVVMDNEVCKNIEITNGKLITNGNKIIAVGYAMPGLKESLGLEDKDINISDIIEISLETDKFELGNIMTYANPNIFGDLDISMDDFDELFEKFDELQDASIQMEDGSVELNDGMIRLNEGVIQIDSGTGELKSGIDALKTGSETLNVGANTLKHIM